MFILLSLVREMEKRKWCAGALVRPSCHFVILGCLVIVFLL